MHALNLAVHAERSPTNRACADGPIGRVSNFRQACHHRCRPVAAASGAVTLQKHHQAVMHADFMPTFMHASFYAGLSQRALDIPCHREFIAQQNIVFCGELCWQDKIRGVTVL
jgi:hypothetical protein